MASEFEHIFDAYLQAQHDLFLRLNAISSHCREQVDAAKSTDERGMFKNILSSIIRFESAFSQLEEDFWAYLEGDTNSSYYENIAESKGYHNFVDYLLGDLEKCHSWIDDMNTELTATGWAWESLDGLSDEFWKLIDATENLIEASAGKEGRDSLLELMKRIPPQRFAPIELEVQGERFTLRKRNRSPTNVSAASMKLALKAVKNEVVDALLELQKTNCDRRFVTYFARLVSAIDREFETISAIEIGINLLIVQSAMPSVRNEIADVIFSRLVADSVNVRHFLNNFRDWREYLSGGIDLSASDQMFRMASDIGETFDHEAFGSEVLEAQRYYSAVCEVVDGPDAVRIRSSFVQGILNAVIVCSRESLKFIRTSTAQVAEGTNRAVGTVIGTAAAAWILLNATRLKEFADSHVSLGWIKDVISVVSKHFSGS